MSWRNTKKTRSKEPGQFMKMKGLFLNSWKNCWIFWSVRFYDVSGQLVFMTVLVSQVFMMSIASHDILWRFGSVSFVTSDQSAFLIFIQFLYNFIQICTSKMIIYFIFLWSEQWIFLETMLIELSIFLHVAGCRPGSLPSCVETRWLWICQYACCLLSNGMFVETLNHI